VTPDTAAMVEDLRRWCADLSAPDVTASSMAAAISGEDAGDGSEPQLSVRPSDPAWSQATVVQGVDGPDHVILSPAEGSPLTSEDLEDAFGPVKTTPPRIHFDEAEQRIYQVDVGQPGFTTALIAELSPAGDGVLEAVVLRRDIRLE
jgi:hypothetical protein